jgi:hypothetical protein
LFSHFLGIRHHFGLIQVVGHPLDVLFRRQSDAIGDFMHGSNDRNDDVSEEVDNNNRASDTNMQLLLTKR